MKTIFVIAITAAAFTACNNAGTGSTDTDTIITDSSFDTTSVAPVTTDTVTSVYAPAEGDVMYRDNKVYVMKNGTWAEANNDVTLDNGAVVVYKTGTVKKDKQEIKLKEGETVTKTGDFFDRAGHAISNAWDQTKDAVKDAGRAIDKTAKKAGAKIDSVVH